MQLTTRDTDLPPRFARGAARRAPGGILLAALLVLTCACAKPLPPVNRAGLARFEPPDTSILLIVGQDLGTIEDYSRRVDSTSAGVMVYTSLNRLEGLTAPSDLGSGIQDFSALARNYPGRIIQIGLWMGHDCRNIALGMRDPNIHRLAKVLKQANCPIFLRVGYEFDNPGFGYPPEVYVPAYRRLVDFFRKDGVTNVAFVWHSYASSVNQPYEDWYPGDTYVDWCAISFFSRGEKSEATDIAAFARKHHKPLMIAEATPYNIRIPQDRDNAWYMWYQPFFEFVHREKVKAVCYINSNWDAQPMWKGQLWGDARVQADSTVRALWLKETRRLEYVHVSSDLYRQIGFEPAQKKN